MLLLYLKTFDFEKLISKIHAQTKKRLFIVIFPLK